LNTIARLGPNRTIVDQDALLCSLLSPSRKRKLKEVDMLLTPPTQQPTILLPGVPNILKKKRLTFKSEDKNEVLKILSHCESKDTLELGAKEIERLCPKLNGLTTRKIEMWRVNEVTCPQSYMSRCNLCKCKH